MAKVHNSGGICKEVLLLPYTKLTLIIFLIFAMLVFFLWLSSGKYVFTVDIKVPCIFKAMGMFSIWNSGICGDETWWCLSLK